MLTIWLMKTLLLVSGLLLQEKHLFLGLEQTFQVIVQHTIKMQFVIQLQFQLCQLSDSHNTRTQYSKSHSPGAGVPDECDHSVALGAPFPLEPGFLSCAWKLCRKKFYSEAALEYHGPRLPFIRCRFTIWINVCNKQIYNIYYYHWGFNRIKHYIHMIKDIKEELY